MCERIRIALPARALLIAAVFLPSEAAAQDGRPVRANAADTGAMRVLVLVDGEPITEGDLNLLMISRRVSREEQARSRGRFLEHLIDRRVMQAYLKGRKVKPGKLELDAQADRILKLIRKKGDDPQTILKRLGYTEKTLREELALPLSWKRYVGRIITNAKLREHFRKNRSRFDGTQLRASQILLKVPAGENAGQVKAARDRLEQIRADVAGGKITFAKAAKMYSQAPSREDAGDVGFFPYQGKMPESFTRVAFGLKVGEIGRPFVSPFGVHLLKVTGRKPGDLSLEDVRLVVFNRLAAKHWTETVHQQRAKAQIEWKDRPAATVRERRPSETAR